MSDASEKPPEEPTQASSPGEVYDDGYTDPPSASALIVRAGWPLTYESLFVMAQRIRTLEEALLPLAARATVMNGVRMNMIAAGRTGCAGGTWIQTDEGPMALFTESEHHAALDAVGRERTRRYMASLVVKQAMREQAAQELKSRVESGEKTH